MSPQTKQVATHDCTCCGQDLRLPADAYNQLRLAERVCEQIAFLIARSDTQDDPRPGIGVYLRRAVAEWEKIS